MKMQVLSAFLPSLLFLTPKEKGYIKYPKAGGLYTRPTPKLHHFFSCPDFDPVLCCGHLTIVGNPLKHDSQRSGEITPNNRPATLGTGYLNPVFTVKSKILPGHIGFSILNSAYVVWDQDNSVKNWSIRKRLVLRWARRFYLIVAISAYQDDTHQHYISVSYIIFTRLEFLQVPVYFNIFGFCCL